MKFAIVILAIAALSIFAEDFEYNTGGAMGTAPTTGGSFDGWGEWFITSVLNDTGHDLVLTELGFPCGGPATGDYGWIVWTDVGGLVAPTGEADSADYYGAFTPTSPDPSTSPPVIYSYIDVSGENIVIPDGNYFCFGYDNTGIGGQIVDNGVLTWSWYEGAWDSDNAWGRTDIMEVSANYDTALTRNSWGSIKASF